MTRSIPTSSSPPTRGRRPFPTSPTAVARDYGFWLDDAFRPRGVRPVTTTRRWRSQPAGPGKASSVIFRELGKDIQRESVTVVGVGDMSGDVFGNGMLLSRTLKLRAAFDHRDIFIDPQPDPVVSWEERKRLFDLPRSSWQDYNRAAISLGGGVWSRSLKSIPLAPEARAPA